MQAGGQNRGSEINFAQSCNLQLCATDPKKSCKNAKIVWLYKAICGTQYNKVVNYNSKNNPKIVLCTIAFNRIAMRFYAAHLGLRLGVRRFEGKSIRGGVTPVKNRCGRQSRRRCLPLVAWATFGCTESSYEVVQRVWQPRFRHKMKPSKLLFWEINASAFYKKWKLCLT